MALTRCAKFFTKYEARGAYNSCGVICCLNLSYFRKFKWSDFLKQRMFTFWILLDSCYTLNVFFGPHDNIFTHNSRTQHGAKDFQACQTAFLYRTRNTNGLKSGTTWGHTNGVMTMTLTRKSSLRNYSKSSMTKWVWVDGCQNTVFPRIVLYALIYVTRSSMRWTVYCGIYFSK